MYSYKAIAPSQPVSFSMPKCIHVSGIHAFCQLFSNEKTVQNEFEHGGTSTSQCLVQFIKFPFHIFA